MKNGNSQLIVLIREKKFCQSLRIEQQFFLFKNLIIFLFFFLNIIVYSYEVAAFQKKVMEMFQLLKDDSYWTEINADKTEAELHAELLQAVEKIMKQSEGTELEKLW